MAFDYKKLPKNCVIRMREEGDVFTPYNSSAKKLKDYFIDKKIPVYKRKRWPVIVDKFGVLLLVIGIKKFYNDESSLNKDYVDFYVCQDNEIKGE